MAKDIQVGDNLMTIKFDDMPVGDLECILGEITDNCNPAFKSWSSETLDGLEYVTSRVTDIFESTDKDIVVFNNNPDSALSTVELALVYTDGKHSLKEASEISVGDYIVTYNGQITNTLVESVELNGKANAYLFYREGNNMIITGGPMVVNGCPLSSISSLISQ